MADFLHNHRSFKDLLLILEREKSIVPGLLEKDYWIMHVLFGLKQSGLSFELKGGTSLSKGLGIISRFSEDIDIRINPPVELKVNETGTKGFDQVTPNKPVDISSWALDKAKAMSGIPFIDNTAREIPCYDMRYTFVEKLQTIVTKFRQEMADGKERKNYMRQYYDVYCLLQKKAVQEFLGTDEYLTHKDKRFPKIDKSTEIQHNEAFLLSSDETRSAFRERYHATSSLYFQGQPDFDKVIEGIRKYLPMM